MVAIARRHLGPASVRECRGAQLARAIGAPAEPAGGVAQPAARGRPAAARPARPSPRAPSPAPSLAPTTTGYKLAGILSAEVVGGDEGFVEAPIETLVNLTKPLVVKLKTRPSADVAVTLTAAGTGSALRFYEEDSKRPGFALASDPGGTTSTKTIPSNTTTLTVIAGALRDRVNSGTSFSQTVEISLDSEDPNYCCGRHTASFELEVGDVDTCLLYTSPSPRDRTRSRMPSSA